MAGSNSENGYADDLSSYRSDMENAALMTSESIGLKLLKLSKRLLFSVASVYSAQLVTLTFTSPAKTSAATAGPRKKRLTRPSVMGTIPGLCGFMERNSGGMIEKVNLEELAMKYKEDTGRDPVMLVDVSNILSVYQKSGCNTYHYGHLKRYKKNLETLINNCYKIKIKLIFIGVGITLEEYDKEKLKAYCSPSDFHRGILFNVANCTFMSSEKCVYIRAKYRNRILNYAKTYGCFAIFAHGSAYVLAEGAQYSLSCKYFDFDNMTTINYNKNQLAKVLNISPSQLPLFGAVSACQTIIPKYQFLKVAELMKKNFSSVEIEDFPEIFKMDVEKFNNHLKYFSGERLNEVLKPVDGDWDRILRLAEERHVAGVAHRFVLKCLLHYTFFQKSKAIHKFLSPGAELLPLRARIYGILFSECPGEIFIKDHFFPGSGTTELEVHEIFVSKSAHCGLNKLWSEDYPKDEKVRLFCRVFSSNLTPQDLNEIDIKEELLFPFLTVFYLSNEVERKLTEFELKTMLIQSILANELTDEDTEFCEKWDDPEVFELCDRFSTTVDHIMFLNSVCGNPFCMKKTSMENYYDACLFKHVYRTLKDENFEKDTDLWDPNVCATYKNLLSGLEQLENECGYTN